MNHRGFTLIEMLVAVALFTVVMVMALGALLALSESDRRAEVLKSAINNIDFSLDSMSRAIRTGTTYYCGSSASDNGQNPTTADCSGQDDTSDGGTYLAFVASDNSFVEYQYIASGCGSGYVSGCIEQRITTPQGIIGQWEPITSPNIYFSTPPGSGSPPLPQPVLFYVVGSAPADTLQPKVTILLHAFVPVEGGATSISQCSATGNVCQLLNMQTSITQRVYDQ